jgi:phenylacetate-CoA ligase
MEDWSFPPAYDEAYRPPSDSRYWFPVRETMHPSDREKAILTRLQEVCAYAFDNSPFYRRKWDAAGFHPSLLKSLEQFESLVPVITKAELRAAQAAAAP